MKWRLSRALPRLSRTLQLVDDSSDCILGIARRSDRPADDQIVCARIHRLPWRQYPFLVPWFRPFWTYSRNDGCKERPIAIPQEGEFVRARDQTGDSGIFSKFRKEQDFLLDGSAKSDIGQCVVRQTREHRDTQHQCL